MPTGIAFLSLLLLHDLFFAPSFGAIALTLTALIGLVALPFLWFLRKPWHDPPRKRPPLRRLLLIAGLSGLILALISSSETLTSYIGAPAGAGMIVREMFADTMVSQVLPMFVTYSIFVLGIATCIWWVVDRFRGTPTNSLPPSPGTTP